MLHRGKHAGQPERRLCEGLGVRDGDAAVLEPLLCLLKPLLGGGELGREALVFLPSRREGASAAGRG